jgi:hypothetical protein
MKRKAKEGVNEKVLISVGRGEVWERENEAGCHKGVEKGLESFFRSTLTR